MGKQTLGEAGQRNEETRTEQVEVLEETGSPLCKGYIAAAAATATIGVVEQAGQLSYLYKRLSLCEVTCLLMNTVQFLTNN